MFVSTCSRVSPAYPLSSVSGVHICEIMNIPAQDFFWKWEASNFNTKKGAFTLAAAHDLKEDLQREQDKKVAMQRQRANVASALTRRPMGGVLNIGRSSMPQTPIKSESKVVSGLNVPKLRQPIAGPSRVRFHDGPLQTDEAKKGRACTSLLLDCAPYLSQSPVRYMYEKISERSERERTSIQRVFTYLISLVLDDRIDEFADIFREAYSIEDFGDPAAVTEVRMSD
jgi:hypothetical protein